MNRKQIFEYIYQTGAWNDSRYDIPRSGPGSSVENTTRFRDLFDKFCIANDVQEVLDIGCGDLTWMPLTQTFQTKKYTGIDIVQSLIDSHSIRYPQHKFLCLDAVSSEIPYSEVVCIRDVLFHLPLHDIGIILDKIRCRYLFVTSSRNEVNLDTLYSNKSCFHTVNLTKAPFYMTNYIASIYEPEFDRDVFIFKNF